MPVTSEFLPPQAFGVVLVGPSGVGKTTLAASLQANGIVEVKPTMATRGTRPIERQNPPCDHTFISALHFKSHDATGGFFAKRFLYGNHYGIPVLKRPAEDRIPLLVLKPVFIEELLGGFPNMRVYQIEASPEVLMERMLQRGQSDSDIARRMEEQAAETLAGRALAHCIFNNDGPLLQTLNQLTEQIYLDNLLFAVGQTPSEPGQPIMLQ